MKALTLIQPWAFAIEHLGKPVENRTWPPPRTLIGQRFCIHAGKSIDDDALGGLVADLADDFSKGKAVPSLPPGPLPRGAITCSVVLRGWVRGSEYLYRGGPEVLEVAGDVAPERAREMVRSRWWVGPIGWVLDEVHGLTEPVPCRGALGLWTVPDDVAARVRVRHRP